MKSKFRKTRVGRSAASPAKPQMGQRIRRLRLQQNRTQAEVAAASDLTKSMLSKIEAGAAFPSVAALVRVAAALGTNVSVLMEEGPADQPLFVPRVRAEGSLQQSEKGYCVYPYATEIVDKKMQPFLFVVKKGQVQQHRVSHPGEEFLCVLEGEILFSVGDTEFHMRPGDGLFFQASTPHGVQPVTTTAKYLDVFV